MADQVRPKRRQSYACKELFGESFREVDQFVSKNKLPSGKIVIGRMLSLCKQPEKGHKSISRDEASKVVARELSHDWISKNVYPMTEASIAKKIREDYEKFKTILKGHCLIFLSAIYQLFI